MGLAVPRPTIRRKENRLLTQRLARHAELMAEYETQGMTREEASAKAMEDMRAELPRG